MYIYYLLLKSAVFYTQSHQSTCSWQTWMETEKEIIVDSGNNTAYGKMGMTVDGKLVSLNAKNIVAVDMNGDKAEEVVIDSGAVRNIFL